MLLCLLLLIAHQAEATTPIGTSSSLLIDICMNIQALPKQSIIEDIDFDQILQFGLSVKIYQIYEILRKFCDYTSNFCDFDQVLGF